MLGVRHSAGRGLAAAVGLGALAACAGQSGDARAARDTALRALFLAHERPRVLVVWAERGAPGPVFAELAPSAPDAVPARDAPPAAVGAVPVVALRRQDLDALFRTEPDGWKAFYARYPGATGLIELSPVRLTGDSASLLVGRSCGEHCRTAWRVRLGRRAGATAWSVARVEFVVVPNS